MNETIWLNWPIRIRISTDTLAWRSWFTWHGIEACRPYYWWVFHLGPIKVIFGESQGKFLRDHWQSGFETGVRYERTYPGYHAEAES